VGEGDKPKIIFGNYWSDDSIKNEDLNVILDRIVTGRTVETSTPDFFIFPVLGVRSQKRRILDFGCGVGRNAFALADYSPNWEIVGYDNQNMISRSEEYCQSKFGKLLTDYPNLQFESDWTRVKSTIYDATYAGLVFQHIPETTLKNYLHDLRMTTTKLLVVHGRKFNDDNQKDTWKIMESMGYYPVVSLSFNDVGMCIIQEYNPSVEHLESHMTNIYSI
jgi:SAM-dependent methyltransferase